MSAQSPSFTVQEHLHAVPATPADAPMIASRGALGNVPPTLVLTRSTVLGPVEWTTVLEVFRGRGPRLLTTVDTTPIGEPVVGSLRSWTRINGDPTSR